jgi:hypothetical protein
MQEEFKAVDYRQVRFVPTNAYAPEHQYVKSWIFPFDPNRPREEYMAEREANLADAVARVAADNGLSSNDVQYLFPAILRMLKSTSKWAK